MAFCIHSMFRTLLYPQSFQVDVFIQISSVVMEDNINRTIHLLSADLISKLFLFK